MREWRIAAIVFALAAAVFTAAGFLPGRVMIPLDLPRDTAAWKANPDERVVVSNKLLSDPMFAFYTWDREARRQLARGEFPWRNVWAADGAHLFANPEAALLFPLTWIRIALGDRGWALYCFLKLFLAGLGMWWLARVATGCDWRSALVAGLAYMASGYMTVWLLWSHTNIYAMLPGLAASAISLARAPSPRWAAATIALAALTTAGGHPETLFYGVLGIALFIAITERRLWLTATCALIGFALLAVQLVPFAKAAAECDLLAQRRNHPERFARIAAIPATLLPGYLGSPLAGEIDLTPLVPHDRGENFNERNSAYAGLAALIVVLAAWRRVPRAALAIAFAALLLSWHLPLLRVVERIPPLSFGASSRLSLVFPFFVTMCLGAALDGLSCHPERSEGPGWEGLRAARAPRPLATLGVTRG